MAKELTKTKLHNILKKYRAKLDQHNKEWESVCRKKCKRVIEGDRISVTTPSIYECNEHTSKGDRLFKALIAEFDEYEVFPKNKQP
jgi:hypothetical protein